MSLGSPTLTRTGSQTVPEALATAHADTGVHTYSDTFADVDCGYFSRCGVVNRLYNPRTGFHILRLECGLGGGGQWGLEISQR
jgi:hypothetical protein